LRGINAPTQGPQFSTTTGSATSVEIYFKETRSESTIRSSSSRYIFGIAA
jgi:hypothetical protein